MIQKRKDIIKAFDYTSSPNPLEAIYLGSMQQHHVFTLLGSVFGLDSSIKKAVKTATEEQIEAAHSYMYSVIECMKKEDRLPAGFYETDQVEVSTDPCGDLRITFKIKSGKYKGRIIQK